MATLKIVATADTREIVPARNLPAAFDPPYSRRFAKVQQMPVMGDSRPPQVVIAERIRQVGSHLAEIEEARVKAINAVYEALEQSDRVGIPREYFFELLGVGASGPARRTALSIIRRASNNRS